MARKKKQPTSPPEVEAIHQDVPRLNIPTEELRDFVVEEKKKPETMLYPRDPRWITIDTSRVALALARTRLMAAKYPYYLLADSTEGLARQRELYGTTFPPVPGIHAQDERATGDSSDAQDERASSGSAFQAGAAADIDCDVRQVEIAKRQGAYLPHWTAEGATYGVTFRLADSLPRAALEAFLRERSELVKRAKAAGRELSPAE